MKYMNDSFILVRRVAELVVGVVNDRVGAVFLCDRYDRNDPRLAAVGSEALVAVQNLSA